jgi:hypothetical protein
VRSSRLSLNAWVSRSTARCLATPYSELSQLLSSRARPKNLGETIRELDNLIENAVRTRGYLDMRYGHGCGDQGHAAGVKKSNRLAKLVRKALGFTYYDQPLNF